MWTPVAALATRLAVTLPTPVQLSVPACEIDPRQGHRDPSGAAQHAVAELDQNLEPLAARAVERIDGAQCGGRGGRAVAESVHHAEQGSAHRRCRSRSPGRRRRTRRAAGDPRSPTRSARSRPFSCTHGPEPISTFRRPFRGRVRIRRSTGPSGGGHRASPGPARGRSSIRPPSRARCRRCRGRRPRRVPPGPCGPPGRPPRPGPRRGRRSW